MDIKTKVVVWSQSMGFDGEIPPSLENICTHSTTFLWQELMQNVRPKQQASSVRNNVILQRLKERSLEKQDSYSFPMREVDYFQIKQELEKKKSCLQEIVKEKKNKANYLGRESRIKFISKQILESHIKEGKEKEYILNLKAKELQKQINDSDELLTTAKNVTPIELDENPNKTEITETLLKCAEKLQLLVVQKLSQTQSNFAHEVSSISQLSLRTPAKPDATINQLLTFSKQKTFNNRGNLQTQKSLTHDYIQKNLFEQSEIKISESEKIESVKQPKKKSRESLGILDESYFKNNSMHGLDIDNCLLSPIKQNQSQHQEKQIASENLNDSTLDSFISIRSKRELNSVSSETDFVSKKYKNFEEVLTNQAASDLISNLIYNHNRQAIWNVFQTLNDNLCIEITNRILESSNRKGQKPSFEHEKAKLYFLHIQNDLNVKKEKINHKSLLAKINKWKLETFTKLKAQGLDEETYEGIKKSFELKLQDLRYDVTVPELKKHIQLTKKVLDNTELQVVVGKISKAKDEIVLKTTLIQQYMEFIDKLHLKTSKTRENTKISVQKLHPFISDMSWTDPLTEARYTQEITVFENFPLEYNRVCNNINSKVYYRDICINSFPTDRKLSSESLYMLSEVLKNLFSPPETVLFDFVKRKDRLQIFNKNSDISYNKLEELKNILKNLETHEKCDYNLQTHNRQIDNSVEKLSKILTSYNANKIVSLTNIVKQAIEIWEEMPVKHHISRSRLVDGHPYEFYDNKFNLLLENLEF